MTRSIIDFSGREIENELMKARSRQSGVNDFVRILFSPITINEENIHWASSIYSRLNPSGYDTVIIVEESTEVRRKKLLMLPDKTHHTPLGDVPVNDDLRDEFCEEDDDFFIDDSGFHFGHNLFHQLMMLQKSIINFKVLNIQIADEDEYIIKELVSTIDELLPSRNILLIFCCDLTEVGRHEFGKIKTLVEAKSHSSLFNLLNRNNPVMQGTAAFITGILVARRWGLQIRFLEDAREVPSLAAYGEHERVLNKV
jgi:AmmeMemoRadiSam system protein B